MNTPQISQDKAVWSPSKKLFGQSVPQWLVDDLKIFDSFVGTVLDDMNTFIDILKKIEGFIKGVENFFLNAIVGIFGSIMGVINQFLTTSGAGFIIIHPWNSKKAKVVDLFEVNTDGTPREVNTKIIPTPSPGSKTSALTTLNTVKNNAVGKKNKTMATIHSLTPQDAMQDLIDSFTDTTDPNRPQWGDSDYAAGFGILISTADLSGFINLISLLRSFFSFPDLDAIEVKLNKELNEAKNNAGSDWKDIQSTLGQNWSNFTANLSSLSTSIGSIGSNNPTKLASTQAEFQSLIISPFVGVRHWSALNLDNIPLLNGITKEITKLLGVLTALLTDVDDIIDSIINALISKVQYLETVLKGILSAVNTLVVSLDDTGLYTFTVNFGVGGVSYVTQAISSSLATSPVPSLSKSTWSAVFFAGMGTPNYKILEDWITAAFNTLSGDIAGLTSLDGLYDFDYKIDPDFKKKIFNFGDLIELSVSSTKATLTHPVYFTYEVKDGNGKVIGSSTITDPASPSILSVNNSVPTFQLLTSGQDPMKASSTKKFHITVTMFDIVTTMATYDTDFIVSQSISIFDDGTNSKYGGQVVRTRKNSKVQLKKNGKVLNQYYVGANTDTIVGSGVPMGQYQISIIEDDGTVSTLDINNLNGYYDYIFLSASELTSTPFLRVAGFPIIIYMDFLDIMKWGKLGNTLGQVNIPDYILVTSPGIYQYYIQDSNANLTGPYQIDITLVTDNSIYIC